MICWLASYARSGNTLFRVLLNEFFGIATWSLHGDGDGTEIGDAVARRVGFTPHGPLGSDRLAEMTASDSLFFVKTHGLPPIGAASPAICIVRDGRSALASYWHYRNRPGDVAAQMEEVVAGQVQFGSWSEHVEAWLEAPIERRLLLRYEDLVRDPVAAVASVGSFLDLAPRDGAPPSFADLHALAPSHFRAGRDDRNIAELEACCPALFNAVHGPLQQRLGYSLARIDGSATQSLRIELERLSAGQRARAESATREAVATAIRQVEDRARRDAVAAQAAHERTLAEAAALRQEVSDLRQEVSDMRLSPFWRAREATVAALRTIGLRRRP